MENREMNLFDGILAILGGYGAMYIVTKTILTVLAVTSPESANEINTLPATAHVVVILVGTFVAAVVGGITACLIAKRSLIKHTIALSAVAVILGTMTMITGRTGQPLWYSLSLIGLSVIGIMSVGLILQARSRVKAQRL